MAPVLLQRVVAPRIDSAQKELVIIETAKKEIIRWVIVFWLVESTFLFLRIFLEALGTNSQAYFVELTYLISSVFMVPFSGMFPQFESTLQPGVPTFDVSAVVALICYTVMIFFTVGMVSMISKILKTEKQEKQIIEKNNPVDPTVAEKIVK